MTVFSGKSPRQRRGKYFAVALLVAPGPVHAASERVVHAFDGTDGGNPIAGLIDVNGTLYGTTFEGGSANAGTVFSLTTAGVETVVYSFQTGTKDGLNPGAGLVDIGGTLYGTTLYGGSSANCSYGSSEGCGTVFKVTTDGTEKVLHSFQSGTTDGAVPAAALIELNGMLYGTTSGGGSPVGYGGGTIFEVKTSGHETVLHFLQDDDGITPYAGLIKVGGELYGTTNAGGASGNGTVFKVTAGGVVSVLYSFTGPGYGDGTEPAAGLVKVGDAFYGTTAGGGAGNMGTVFSVTAAGVETVLHSCNGREDGANPSAGLIKVGAALYGTTTAGGALGNGTVFKVTAAGSEKTVYSFTGGADGGTPNSGLINLGGTLYGATSFGAGPAHCGGGFCGTVFAITP